MVVVEADLARVEFTDAALHDLELRTRLLYAGRGLLDADRQSADTFVDRLDARAHGVDLAGQPRQSLAAVRLGARRGQVCALRLCRNVFAFGQLGTGEVEKLARRRQLRDELSFASRDLLGLRLHRVRIGPRRLFDVAVEQLRPFTGDAHGRADPFGQRREPKPRLLSRFRPLGQPGHGRLVGGQLDGRRIDARRDLVVLAAQRRLGGVGVVELGLPIDQVVGGETKP